ncbi:MAG TPA: hypothetical protein VLA32_03420 [Anaerolineales bacterium]|nr:hypothetical protein [Anaerolineales bacterium]
MAATQQSEKNNKKRRRVSFSPLGFSVFLLFIMAGFGFLSWQAGYLDALLPGAANPTQVSTQAVTEEPTPSALPISTPTPTQMVVTQPEIPTLPPATNGTLPGLIVFSMSEAGYFHLFAYHPETLPITRLTYGEWDDLQPAISPDGTQIAFTSNRSGHWDLYLLDLTTGETTQFTDDLDYNGHPAWSSDGLWLAYDKYQDSNLDIFIKPVVADIPETRMTTHPAQDFQPAWQPGSTTIAFTSTRTGSQDIYLLDTNQPGSDQNYTINRTVNQTLPAWTPDGSRIVWTEPVSGYPTLFSSESTQEAALSTPSINANLFDYDPFGNYIVSVQNTLDRYYLSIRDSRDYHYIILPTLFPGMIEEVSWGQNLLPSVLPGELKQAAQAQPQTPWKNQLVPSTGALYGRQNIIDLPDIKAPHPALSALAIEPFFALKDRLILALGWDVLSDLENMFVSISEPLPPGRSNDWLYTGRAFALNPVLIDYEYMAVVREEYGSEIYWRVYLKPLDQSGNQGRPLSQFLWDFDARYSGSPSAYESGGEQLSEIPTGYWVDFTTLALEYGWERQSALSNWQSYYQAARFNVFAITSGLTWEDAMLQIWPPEVFQSQGTP